MAVFFKHKNMAVFSFQIFKDPVLCFNTVCLNETLLKAYLSLCTSIQSETYGRTVSDLLK